MQVIKIFDEEEIKKIMHTLAKCNWQDGKKSALGAAKEIKNNRQIFGDQKNFQPITKIISEKFNTPLLKNTVFPKSIIGLRANAYSVGETYGWHVDMAHMTQKRTDMSFTIFLSEKTSYEGGELDIKNEGFTSTVKGVPGEMVIYETGLLHRVRPVTKGERVCLVGWIESLIPHTDSRTALRALGMGVSSIKKSLDSDLVPTRDQYDLLNQTYYQVVRLLTP